MIEYRHNYALDPKDVVRVFKSSGITRPTEDLPRIARMFATSNLIISAWSDGFTRRHLPRPYRLQLLLLLVGPCG